MKQGYRVTVPAGWPLTCVSCRRSIESDTGHPSVKQVWTRPGPNGTLEVVHDAEPCTVLGALPAVPEQGRRVPRCNHDGHVSVPGADDCECGNVGKAKRHGHPGVDCTALTTQGPCDAPPGDRFEEPRWGR